MTLRELTAAFREELCRLSFSPPAVHVYNPLVYAREPYEEYLSRFGNGAKQAVFIGMNPGPWGMTQTGVPFGEISVVRDWLGIRGEVSKPPDEHPKKKVTGFSCHRSEVSGRRLWGLIRERFDTPDRFFHRFFLLNYCPLLFLDAGGKNVTPEKLRSPERAALQAACDRALRRAVDCLKPAHVIGIGNFAANQACAALEGMPVVVGKILHPSPSNPTANRHWAEIALRQLHEQGIDF